MSYTSRSESSVLTDAKSLAEIETENKRLRRLAGDILLEIAELKERQMIVPTPSVQMHRISA